MLPTYPIEGDFIESKSGHIFEIKGFHQPQDQTIAFIRYAPTSKSPSLELERRKRVNSSTCSLEYYKKIYPLKEKFQYIQENHTEYLFSHPNYYFQLQAVTNSEIKEHFLPNKFLQILHISEEILPSSSVLKDAHDLCLYLSKNSGVSYEYIGITGSLLVGLQNEESDIDLIVYGYENSIKIRKVIKENFQNQNKKHPLHAYSMENYRDLYKSRAKGSSISFQKFLQYEVRKLHQGKFRNRDFFIRYLEHSNREEYRKENQFENRTIKSLGRISISGEVVNDEYWWTTPTRVQIADITIKNAVELIPNVNDLLKKNSLKITDIHQIISLRGRYTENVRLLERFHVFGSLELVIPKEKDSYMQISLGTSPKDYFYLQ
ncbi:MAG: hypothetical protein ACTSVL_02345 [Promethearchaeota archaeon]